MKTFLGVMIGTVAVLSLTSVATAKLAPYEETAAIEHVQIAAPIEMRAQYEAAPERTYFEAPGARFRAQLPCRFNRITDRFWNKAIACN